MFDKNLYYSNREIKEFTIYRTVLIAQKITITSRLIYSKRVELAIKAFVAAQQMYEYIEFSIFIQRAEYYILKELVHRSIE